MKWVKCTYCGLHRFENRVTDGYITIGEIYKVTEYIVDNGKEYIKIINDLNKESNSYYAIWAGNYQWFEDATVEGITKDRDNKINSLLDELG